MTASLNTDRSPHEKYDTVIVENQESHVKVSLSFSKNARAAGARRGAQSERENGAGQLRTLSRFSAMPIRQLLIGMGNA
jgi:hypothetical protein